MLRYSLLLFYFFKQKTAYEMRISDWSSDVCSSDLVTELWQPRQTCDIHSELHRIRQLAPRPPVHKPVFIAGNGRQPPRNLPQHRRSFVGRVTDGTSPDTAQLRRSAGEGRLRRSEAHTSELQSLMRISYAVFCLKK